MRAICRGIKSSNGGSMFLGGKTSTRAVMRPNFKKNMDGIRRKMCRQNNSACEWEKGWIASNQCAIKQRIGLFNVSKQLDSNRIRYLVLATMNLLETLCSTKQFRQVEAGYLHCYSLLTSIQSVPFGVGVSAFGFLLQYLWGIAGMGKANKVLTLAITCCSQMMEGNLFVCLCSPTSDETSQQAETKGRSTRYNNPAFDRLLVAFKIPPTGTVTIWNVESRIFLLPTFCHNRCHLRHVWALGLLCQWCTYTLGEFSSVKSRNTMQLKLDLENFLATTAGPLVVVLQLLPFEGSCQQIVAEQSNFASDQFLEEVAAEGKVEPAIYSVPAKAERMSTFYAFYHQILLLTGNKKDEEGQCDFLLPVLRYCSGLRQWESTPHSIILQKYELGDFNRQSANFSPASRRKIDLSNTSTCGNISCLLSPRNNTTFPCDWFFG